MLVITGGTLGVATFAWESRRRAEVEKAAALAAQAAANEIAMREQAERYKVEMREVVDYNVRLERRVSELEAQMVIAMQALRDARISIPQSSVAYNVAGDYNTGGDTVAGGSKR